MIYIQSSSTGPVGIRVRRFIVRNGNNLDVLKFVLKHEKKIEKCSRISILFTPHLSDVPGV